MKFYTRPFVYLTTVFCAGMLVGDLLDSLVYWSLGAVIISLISLVLFRFERTRKWSTIVFAFCATCFLGSILMFTERNRLSTLSVLTDGEEIGVLATVEELDDSGRIWKKAICRTEHILGEYELIEHNEKVLVYFSADAIRENDQILLRSSWKSIENAGNPGEFDARKYWNNRNIYSMGFVTESDYQYLGEQSEPFYEHWREQVEKALSGVFDQYLSGSNLAVAKALILGDKRSLNPEVKAQFSSAGAMHILAVSGLHVGIILEVLIFLFGRFPRFISRKMALISAIVILWVYAMVIGFPASVVRASLMFSLLVVGRISSRQPQSLNTLAFSAFVMLMINPLWLYDIGFQLSYLAMAGILLLYRPISESFYISNKWLKKIWQGTSVGIAAQLFTLPLTLHYFHQFPNYFLITNVGMMFFAGILLVLGMLLLATNWAGVVGKAVAVVFGFGLSVMIAFVGWIDSLPGAVSLGYQIPLGIVIVSYLILVFMLVMKSNKRLLTGALGLSFGLLIFVQFQRYQNLVHTDFRIFNVNQPVMVLKKNNRLTCFHNIRQGDMKKARLAMEAYAKVYPGSIQYIQLKNGVTHAKSGDDQISFIRCETGFLIEVNDSEYFLKTRYGQDPVEDSLVVTMSYLQRDSVKHCLKEGSFQIPL